MQRKERTVKKENDGKKEMGKENWGVGEKKGEERKGQPVRMNED